MSKGFGRIQRKIIAYLEGQYAGQIPHYIIEKIADHKPPTASDKSKIYRAIQSLKRDGILVKGNQKYFWKPGAKYRNANNEPTPLKINKESENYKEYKRKQVHT